MQWKRRRRRRPSHSNLVRSRMQQENNFIPDHCIPDHQFRISATSTVRQIYSQSVSNIFLDPSLQTRLSIYNFDASTSWKISTPQAVEGSTDRFSPSSTARASNLATSATDNSISWKLDKILDSVTDLGKATTPRQTCHEMRTFAASVL